MMIVLGLGGLWAPAAQAADLLYGDPAFARAWARTDQLVAAGQAGRSWYWGPAPGPILREPFAGLPGGVHLVQYFDKSRMEVNDPGADRNSKWFVTNGLLAIELISGRIQTGLDRYENHAPAEIPLASDTDDTSAPTYASFLKVSNTSLGDHPTASRLGGAVTATINRAGQTADDGSQAMDSTRIAYYDSQTHHNIPGVFWTFLNATGLVREGPGTANAPLSDPWNFVTGLPISEAYWARVKIAGQPQWTLIQAYQRRVLTFVPTLAPAWRVQMGNIGQHYYEYRYGKAAANLAATLARQVATPSYHFMSLMELKSGTLLVPFARQSGDFQAPNRTHLVQQSAEGLSEFVTIGATIYVKNTATGGQWQKTAPAGDASFDLSSLLGVLQYATNVTAASDEAMNGIASHHLHMTLDPAVLPTLTGVRYTAAEADVYVTADSNLLTRVRTAITLAPGAARQGVIYVTIDFSDYGKQLNIEAPIL